uniref:Laminin EGF-like domain-containing protein n=1 Tax=Knipowitschia caucasica TaxID=637954 RepID=A0AAV2KX32_KNICA
MAAAADVCPAPGPSPAFQRSVFYYKKIACDCDPVGVSQPQCDRSSGQCVCVEGVTGPRCDLCARGYSGTFPDCHRCHQCFGQWDAIVEQLTNQTQRLVGKVRSLKQSGSPSGSYLLSLEQSAEAVRSILSTSPVSEPLGELQELLQQASELMQSLTETLNSTEAALMPTSEEEQEVHSRLDSLNSDSNKLQRTVEELLQQVEIIRNSDIRGATVSVNKYFRQSQASEGRVNASTLDQNSTVQNSVRLRQLTEVTLNSTALDFLQKQTERAQKLDDLAGDMHHLDVSELSLQMCGSAVSQEACSSSSCGGLGCVDPEGRLCGGENCGGFLTTAKNIWTRAQDSEQEILRAMEEVEELSKRVAEVKVKSDEVRGRTLDVLLKTNNTKLRVDQSNEDLRELIRQIRDFLTQDSADLESIEMVSNEVLQMQMPLRPEQLQNLTEEIRLKVEELGSVRHLLQESTEEILRAEGLLKQARQASLEALQVKDSAEKVKEVLDAAQDAQSAASSAISQTTENIERTDRLLSKVQLETANAEQRLSEATERLQTLQLNVTSLRDRSLNVSRSSEQTSEDAAAIRDIANKVQKDLDSDIKDKYSAVQKLVDEKAEGLSDAKKRAVSLQQEAKELLLQASLKLRLLKELEKSYEDNQNTLEQKAEQLLQLESEVKDLLQGISNKVTVYSTCLL